MRSRNLSDALFCCICDEAHGRFGFAQPKLHLGFIGVCSLYGIGRHCTLEPKCGKSLMGLHNPNGNYCTLQPKSSRGHMALRIPNSTLGLKTLRNPNGTGLYGSALPKRYRGLMAERRKDLMARNPKCAESAPQPGRGLMALCKLNSAGS